MMVALATFPFPVYRARRSQAHAEIFNLSANFRKYSPRSTRLSLGPRFKSLFNCRIRSVDRRRFLFVSAVVSGFALVGLFCIVCEIVLELIEEYFPVLGMF